MSTSPPPADPADLGIFRTNRGRSRLRSTSGRLSFTLDSPWWDDEEIARVVLVVAMLGFAFGGLGSEAPLSYLFWGLAALCALALLALVVALVVAIAVGVVQGAWWLVSRGGPRDLAAEARESVRSTIRRATPRPGGHYLVYADVLSVRPIRGLVRPRLRLATPEGVVRISGWWWQRRTLESVVARLPPMVTVSPD